MSVPLKAPLRAGAVLFSLAVSFVGSWAAAHVQLDSPNGGDAYEAGSTLTVQWRPTAQHETIDWDLWYSTQSPDGPWIEIAMDIELGDPTEGSVHLFDWTPSGPAGEAWVRVRQDNSGDDYYDVSDASFEIVAAPLAGDFNADGMVDSADFTVWRDGYGAAYDLSDYEAWRANFGAGFPEPGLTSPAPEPTAWCALVALVVGATAGPRARCRQAG